MTNQKNQDGFYLYTMVPAHLSTSQFDKNNVQCILLGKHFKFCIENEKLNHNEYDFDLRPFLLTASLAMKHRHFVSQVLVADTNTLQRGVCHSN